MKKSDVDNLTPNIATFPSINSSNSSNDIKAGFIAGMTRAFISQPFDTIKTRMQSSNYKNSYLCLKSSIKNDGFLSLYKGIAFPLIGNAFILGIQFNTYHYFNNICPPISGAMAGLFSSLISNPVELVRIKMQLSNKTHNNKNYKNSFVCAKNIISTNGYAGLFKGQQITTIRDIIGYYGFFYVFDKYPRYQHNLDVIYNKNELYHKITKGILCGFALWGSMYPLDVIKTNIQGSLLENKELTYKKCVQNIFEHHSFKGFYRGFGMTLFRAIPVNIGIVFAMDYFS
jgi:solute carrier family 25 carnitine/acylcarnitine transporter 20/29